MLYKDIGGERLGHSVKRLILVSGYSAKQKRNDKAKQNKTRIGRARDSGDEQSSIYCHAIPLFSVGRPSISLHGVLQWRRVFPR